MRIERFEDLIAWEEARVLTRVVYTFAAKPSLNRDFGLRDQLQRAAVSVRSNTAEGFERVGHWEKLDFMNIARAWRAAVKSLLYVCHDNGHLDEAQVASLQSRCTKISRLVSGLIRSVSRQPIWNTDSDSEP
jgi:four helix bundle protein